MKVYCKDDWTVIHSRGQFGNPIDYFDRSYEEFEDGFGEAGKEQWLGLKNLALLTKKISRNYELKVDLVDLDDVYKEAYFNSFSIQYSKSYTLYASSHQSTQSNLSNAFTYHHGRAFTATGSSYRGNDACLANSPGGNW